MIKNEKNVELFGIFFKDFIETQSKEFTTPYYMALAGKDKIVDNVESEKFYHLTPT